MERRKRLLVAVTVSKSIAFLRGQLAWFQEQGYDVHLLVLPDRCSPYGTGRRGGMMARRVSPGASCAFPLRGVGRRTQPSRESRGQLLSEEFLENFGPGCSTPWREDVRW
jgi:hypothetical protein